MSLGVSCLSVRTGAPATCVLRWKKWEEKGTVSLLGEAALVAQTGNKEMWDPQKAGWELLKLPSPVPPCPSLATALCLFRGHVPKPSGHRSVFTFFFQLLTLTASQCPLLPTLCHQHLSGTKAKKSPSRAHTLPQLSSGRVVVLHAL